MEKKGPGTEGEDSVPPKPKEPPVQKKSRCLAEDLLWKITKLGELQRVRLKNRTAPTATLGSLLIKAKEKR